MEEPPIIALTAKAMKGDREEILNAGVRLPIKTNRYSATNFFNIWVYK
jgi:CheY-like chemotaxis protein